MRLSGLRKPAVLLLCAVLVNASTFIGVNAPSAVYAQGAAPSFSAEQLDSLVAPIALYPDPLLAQVLMASTFPEDVQEAAAWVKANPNAKGDDAVKMVASQPWDPSVQSLVAVPQALATMASKPDWVAQLGSAFLAQPGDVMDSVQRLRAKAQQAGHLQSSEQQKVVVEKNTIQIVPSDPQVIYVPTYNPTVVYGAWPYPAYPPVYAPPPPGYYVGGALMTGLAFGTGIAIANSLWGNCDWNHGDVNVNVNKYNNINANNRINSGTNTARWNNRSTERTAANRQQLNAGNRPQQLGGANRAQQPGGANRPQQLNGANREQRDQFRGRDNASRAQAAQTLQSRTGQNVGGSAGQRAQNIQRGGGVGDAGNRAQNMSRDNALRGAGGGAAARQDSQRGATSRQSMSERTGGRGGGQFQGAGARAGGGGGQFQGGGARAGGGGGQFQGGGARGGGGGGGGRAGGGGGRRQR